MREFKIIQVNKLLLLIIIIISTGCGSITQYKVQETYSENDIFQDHLFGPRIQLPTMDEVLALTPEQKQHFLKLTQSKEYRRLSDSQQIFKYLQKQLEHFNFHSETLIATDAMALNSGNCMSLALLTKALSQLTQVGISYELTRTPPVFQREGNLELNSQHIRTVVYNTNKEITSQFGRLSGKVKIDYFSTEGSKTLRVIKKDEFHSLFYSNRAAEAMIRGEYNSAYWLLKKALKIKRNNIIAINMLGVLYDQKGEHQLAEKSYLYGLSTTVDQLELLNNYHKLLVDTSRTDEAQLIAKTIAEYKDPDPFKWLDLADKKFSEGDYKSAIKYYEKARNLASYLHQPYAGIAKANLQLGKTKRAMVAIQLAIKNSHRPQTTSIYQAKYDHMKSLQNN